MKKDEKDGGNDDPSPFVTRDECTRITSDIRSDMKDIKKALIGEDLRGGMAADLTALKNQVSKLVQSSKERREIMLRWKLALVGAAAAIIAAILTHFLDKL